MANLKINKNGNYVEVLITETGADWTTLVTKAKKNLMDNLELKGFRKGNVPANIAEQNISQESIWHKAADLLIDAQYSEAIELLMKEKIATRPTFEIKAVSNDSIEAILKSVAMPEVKVGNRSSIKIEYKIEEPTQEEIDMEVKQLEQLLQKTIEVEDTTVKVKDGDITNIDFLGKVDGVAFEGGEGKDFDLKIGSKSFIDGFETQVIGMKKGETKDITVTFPEQYPSEDLKGKEAVFTVTLNTVKTTVALEGEELNTKLKSFGFDSKDEIISKIKEVATDRKIQEANDKFFREYVEAIIALEDTSVILPEEILSQEIEQEFKRMEAQVTQSGMNMKEYLKMLAMSAQEFKDNNLKEAATKRVKEGLVYSALVDELNIKADEADFEAEYAKIAKDSKASVEEVKAQIKKDSIESNIIYTKLITAIK